MADLFSNLWDRRRLAQLLSHLEHDRRLLLQGQIGGLAARAQRLEALVRSVEDAGASMDPAHAHMLEQVRAAARRNARLIKAAMGGLAKAETKIKRIAEIASPLRTYSGSGREVLVPVGPGRNDRRV